MAAATEAFTQKSMKSLQWTGDRSMKLVECDAPHIVDPTDAIIRVTSTSICGSDLHLFNKEFSGLKSGDILGHEFMGIVQEVGNQVKDLRPGNRVVCSFLICCGSCDFCTQGLNSCCDKTNTSKQMEESYGHCISGMFGYTRLTGGYAGGQAELVRVPCADTVCLKLPSMDQFPDEKFILLSDVMCTGFHATECGAVCPGQTVAVWGLGPVGLMAAAFCKFRGASRVFGIDCDSFRLDFAKNRLGLEVIDCGHNDVIKALHELAPGGVDVAIDAAGFRFPQSLKHKLQRTLSMETDSPEILTQMVKCVRKAGNISIVGDYYQLCNGFPIGAVMEKSLNIRGGQTHVQRYWPYLLDLIITNQFDPSFIISHIWPLERGVEAYKIFDTHKDNCIKFVLKTEFGTKLAHQHKWTVDDASFSHVNMAPLQTDPPVHINPGVVAQLPWATYPVSNISNADLPSGEKTGLSCSYHKPIKGAFYEACAPYSSSASSSSARKATVPDPASGAGGKLATEPYTEKQQFSQQTEKHKLMPSSNIGTKQVPNPASSAGGQLA